MKQNLSGTGAWWIVAALATAWALSFPPDPLAITRHEGPEGGEATEAPGPYERGVALAEAGNCTGALAIFAAIVEADPKDADAWNMLGYCERKTGRVRVALAYYGKALELRPRFPEAREYLAEAHLDAALEQLALLRSYGNDGRAAVTTLVDAFHAAAARASSDAPAPALVAPRRW